MDTVMVALPQATKRVCEAHASKTTGRCSTNAQYNEEHHVIPQAWQNFDLGKEALFDPRTAALCPTGHRNVHFWIVRLVKSLPVNLIETRTPAGDRAAISNALHDVRRAARKEGRSINLKEFEIARLAPSRWVDSGRALKTLTDAKLWGEA